MSNIRFKCYQIKSGVKGHLHLFIPGAQEGREQAEEALQYRKLVEFLKQKQEKEAEKRKQISTLDELAEFDRLGLPLWVEIEIHYRRATPSQWRLLMMMIRRIADYDAVDWKKIYASARNLYFPLEEDVQGNMVKKSSDDLTTVEMARVIQGVFVENYQRADPADLSDIYVLWSDWRYNKAEVDPLGGTYPTEADYRAKQPICEICCRPFTEDEQGELLHIVAQGAGGPDNDDNRFFACHECHRAQQHQNGWNFLLGLYPHVKGKVKRALELYGKGEAGLDATKPSVPDKDNQALLDGFDKLFDPSRQSDTSESEHE
jgi:hypothetical protein